MRQTLILALVFALVFMASASAQTASPTALLPESAPSSLSASAPPTGLWLTDGQKSAIRIDPCSQGWCGRVAWIIQGGRQTDGNNPDATHRDRPVCGLPVLWGFHQQDAAHWTDGTVYKLDNGQYYHATLQLLPSGNLLVHGYVGTPLFGISQIWTPASATDYPACSP